MTLLQHMPPHPVEFIRQVYMEPFKLDFNEVSRELHVSPSTFNRLLNCKSDISPEMAIKLSKVLGRSTESWMLMQNNYDLHKAQESLNLDDYKAIDFAA